MDAAMTARPRPAALAWIKDGALVVYESSPGRRFAGVVDGEPRLLGGHTWCVHLKDMDHEYGRATVKAAACDRLTPRGVL